MSDKKVERGMRGGQAGQMTPAEVFQASSSKHGTTNMTEAARDTGKSAVLEKFRDREERYRRDQALQAHAQVANHLPGEVPTTPEAAAHPEEPAKEGGTDD